MITIDLTVHYVFCRTNPGGNNYQAALDYIMEKFLMKNRSRQRQIYTHVTCATDTANIRVVFDAVKVCAFMWNVRVHKLIRANHLFTNCTHA